MVKGLRAFVAANPEHALIASRANAFALFKAARTSEYKAAAKGTSFVSFMAKAWKELPDADRVALEEEASINRASLGALIKASKDTSLPPGFEHVRGTDEAREHWIDVAHGILLFSRPYAIAAGKRRVPKRS